MPYIHGTHDGRAALTRVAIIDAARHREHKQSRNPVLRGVKPYRALIDTGATSTMITRNVVSELALQPATKLPYHSKDGLIWTTAYLFHVAFYGEKVALPGDSEEDGESLVESIHVCTRVIIGGEISNEPSFDVLLGMDVITTGTLNIHKDGTFYFVL